MKKFVALLLALIFTVSFMSTVSYAAQSGEKIIDPIETRNLYISNLRCTNSLSGTKMLFTALFRTNEVSYCRVVIDLERSPINTNNFQFYCNLVDTEVDGDPNGSENHTVPASATKNSGYKYRAKVTVYAYNTKGFIIDNDSVYSGIIN